jgi:uncharacterized protein (TIGR00730 family)
MNSDEETAEVLEDTLYNLWSVVNDLSRIKPKQERNRVTIFGSSRVQPDHSLYDEVKELAKRLAEMNCDIVTGGGPGLMQAANEGEELGDPDDRTRSVGIRVDLPFEQGANPFVTTVYTHETFFTRLHHFVRLSNAFIVVEGGLGTTLELAMVWQLLQVDHIEDVPLVLLGDMWDDLIDWAETHMISGEIEYASPADIEIPHCVSSVDEAVDVIAEHVDE